MKILISKFLLETLLGLPFKETFDDILKSSVILRIQPAKVCIYIWKLALCGP